MFIPSGPILDYTIISLPIRRRKKKSKCLHEYVLCSKHNMPRKDFGAINVSRSFEAFQQRLVQEISISGIEHEEAERSVQGRPVVLKKVRNQPKIM